MSKAPKISVLVPIYNVETYLSQCLDSLVHQTFTDIEIICINDGSSDGSAAIIQEFQKSDSRIKVIDKKNTGYGDSMNRGLKKATGEYIAIVEPDDYIDLNAFEKLYDYASTYDAEVVRANYYFNQAGEDQKNVYLYTPDTGRIINPRQRSWLFYQAPSIWAAIYKRDFLRKNQIDFLTTPGASYQDTGFNFKVLACAEKVFLTPEAFLHYRTDNESSSINNPGKVLNVCYEYAEIEKFLKKHHRFTELAPTMEVSKFGAYCWNFFRLKTKLLPEFINQVRTEYQQAARDNLLIESYFEPYKWKFLQTILHKGNFAVICHIKRITSKQKFRQIGKKILMRIRPMYRKQFELAQVIRDLDIQNTLLEIKIARLYQIPNSKTTQEQHHDKAQN